MAQDDWFTQSTIPVQSAPAPAAPVRTVLPSPPVVAAPVNPLDAQLKGIQIQKGLGDVSTLPYDARIAAANATKAEADAARALAGGDKSATEVDLAAKEQGAQRRSMVVKSILGDVAKFYKEDIQGQPMSRGFGASEYINALPSNERFSTAGRNILPMIRPLVAQTAKEGDSDKEMEVFLSYVPSADDSDITIEYKIKALEALVAGMVDGKPPSESVLSLGTQTGSSLLDPPSPTPQTWTKEQAIAKWGSDLRDESGNPLGPDGGPSYDAAGNYKGFAADVQADAPVPVAPVGQTAGEGFMAGVGDVVQGGVNNTVGLIANPVNASINYATGSNLSTDIGMTLRQALGLPENQSKVASAINQAGAGAMGLTGIAGQAARAVPGAVGSALEIAGQQIGRQTLSGSAAGGTAEQLQQEGASPLAQAAGSIVAGMGTYSGANALANFAQRATGVPGALAAAGGRQGVDILPADVGGALTRRLTAAAAQAPISAGPVINAGQRSAGQMKGAVQRIAARQGETVEPDILGEQVRSAGQNYVKNESARIGRIYEQAGNAAKGVRIKPNQALAEIDAQIARYSELGDVAAPTVNSLKSIRDSIANGVSVQGMRDARTILSQGVYDGKLRSNQEKKMFGDILNSLSSDIDLGLRSAGRDGAARQFRRADTLWRERIQTIDDVLEPVIGQNKSGEDVLGALESMTRGKAGGVTRLRGIMQEMPKEEAGNIRATLIDRLGKAGAGQQNNEGTAFSPATFLTNWNKMSPRAKAIMFSDGKLRSDLDDIAMLANATKEGQRYANSSNTAGGMLGNVGAGAGLAAFSPGLAATALGSQYVTGRLLASPRFAAWLARVPKNPGAQGRYIEQLSSVAAKEPAIAGDAQALQQHLMNALEQSPRRAAAGEQEDNRRPEPPQR